ncbi:hypothetical protein SARC_05663 [Sphaeroforma arctica JP610]|uniref:Uncharacterized protein n=1 Tax=Sphaeroforma arctica JP610 TaxID=667725 RepID=A0A0L0FZQ0_9EUKA|nr:hypothetical protein SARC_05663 [Sphaeroforma arctica JP610]KNC82046.1 hypothetical protein SARC_05663 [Sphaeroforma arctica JP610]|eukprot:XP_014155948.1 hypothetical protein SARC_05663 [Sphaeroforma arctica JP610]
MVKPKIANKIIPDKLHPVTTRTAALATSAILKINVWRKGENKYTKPTEPLVKKTKTIRRASKSLHGEPSTVGDLMYLQRHAHYEELIDKKAVEVASSDGWFSSDTRLPEEKVTYRFIKVDNFNEWQLVNGTENIVPMPEPMFPGLRVDVHPMRACEQNIADIKRALKGCPDLLTAFRELPEMRERCVGMFSWAGAYGGSFVANDMYNTVKEYDTPYIMSNLNCILEYICPVIDLRKIFVPLCARE